MKNEGFTGEIKIGLILCMLSSNRPINELLNPNLLDQRSAFENQFEGMSAEPFSYEEYESTRTLLAAEISRSLTNADKEFLIGFKNLEPDWRIYDFENFPSVQWKLHNIKNLKESNPNKHHEQLELLKRVLNSF